MTIKPTGFEVEVADVAKHAYQYYIVLYTCTVVHW